MSPIPGVQIEDLKFIEGREVTLYVGSWASQASTLYVMGFTKHGPIAIRHVTNADKSLAYTMLRLPDYPLCLMVYPVMPVRRGNLFVTVFLRLTGSAVHQLCSGYITAHRYLFWPGGTSEDSVEGPGVLGSLAGTNPATGAEISQAVPTNELRRMISMRFALVTSSTVADRRVKIVLDDGTNVLLQRDFGVVQAASLTRTYEVLFGEKADDAAFDTNNEARIYLPPSAAKIPQAFRIRTITTNLQSGDDYGAPRLFYEMWIEE